MKKHEIKIGETYLVKVSDRIQNVRIDAAHPGGGWIGTNLRTKRSVRIRSAARLRALASDSPATAARAMNKPGSGNIGKRFRAPYADGAPLWEIKARQRSGVYWCEAVDEPIEIDGRTFASDFAGVTKLFTIEEIRRCIGRDEWARTARDAHQDFYASLVPGQIVHYHNYGGAFVRCRVVLVTEIRAGDTCTEIGKHALEKIALVGTWNTFDLQPSSYHARGVLEGRRFQPNYSTIYECPKASIAGPDPRSLPPIDLRPATVPQGDFR